MAILNKIRQKTVVLVLVIALALFAFILSGLFDGSASFSNKSQNVVGAVNGKDISREDFLAKVEAAQKQAGVNATSTQVMNRVWEQEVRQAVMEAQFEELGISVEKDQMKDLLKTALATSPEFLNEAGLFDENKLNEYIINLKETSPVGYNGWVNYEKSLATNALQQNYFNLVKAGLTGTLAEGELEHKLNGNKVDIKFVQVPFSSIPDSIITVSKSDISNYINKNKKQFEVEASRDIKYVEFKEVATVEDENEIKNKLVELLNGKEDNPTTTTINEIEIGFATTDEDEGFVNANSDIKFDNRFVFKSGLPTAVADSIFNLNAGDTYGPYKDANYFKISKVVAVTKQADSVKARHILIPFIGTRTATDSSLTKEAAKVQVDSLLKIFKSSKAKFADIAKELSVDKGSGAKGGDLGYFTPGTMVPEFNDFCFQGKTGDIGIVETQFGFHIIDIEEQKNIQRAVQVGTLARIIEPSEATIDKIFRDASSFEIAVDKKDFQEVATEDKYAVRPVNGIKILDENIPGVGNQRPIVRWAFEAGTEVGAVKRFTIPNGYAIVQLVAKHEEGVKSVEDASATVLPIVRKEKKAKLIRERVSATTLEDLAAAENTTIRSASAINMKTPTISGAGREPLIVGAAFGLEEGETSKLIDGANGVYMVQVIKVTPAVELDNYQAAANRVEQQKVSVVTSKLYNALKEAAEIEDNRASSQVQ